MSSQSSQQSGGGTCMRALSNRKKKNTGLVSFSLCLWRVLLLSNFGRGTAANKPQPSPGRRGNPSTLPKSRRSIAQGQISRPHQPKTGVKPNTTQRLHLQPPPALSWQHRRGSKSNTAGATLRVVSLSTEGVAPPVLLANSQEEPPGTI